MPDRFECPECGDSLLWEEAYYDRDDWDWETMTFQFECPKCGARWSIEYRFSELVVHKED